MKNISFLLGSGFSAPDNMKTVGQINGNIRDITLKDIHIHSDMTFILLSGQKKPKISTHWQDELFFVHFINFYHKNVKVFDYEELYDYITSFGQFKKKEKEIQEFFYDFKTKIIKSNKSVDNLDNYM